MSDWLPDTPPPRGSEPRTPADVGATPELDGMRWSRRVLLLALTLLSYVLLAFVMLRPDWLNWLWSPGFLLAPVGIVWLGLMLVSLLQVSHRWKAWVPGALLILTPLTPGLFAFSALGLYADAGMEEVSARVVENLPSSSRIAGYPMRVDYGDETGVAYWRSYDTGRTWNPQSGVPGPSAHVTVLRDPRGLLPPLAGAERWTMSVPASLVGLAVSLAPLAVIGGSALTRKKSVITAVGENRWPRGRGTDDG